MRRAPHTLLSALAAVLLQATVAAPLLAQGGAARTTAPARLDALMSSHDLRETGLSRLTPAERAALERWLARYTATVAAGAAGAVDERIARPAPAPADDPRVVRPTQGGYQVAPGAIVEVTGVLDGGGYVTLADGTMWEVWGPDQPRVAAWSAGDHVMVRREAAPPAARFDLRLENGRARTMAVVRFAGVVSGGSAAYGAPLAPTVFYGTSQQFIEPLYYYVPYGAVDPWGRRTRAKGHYPRDYYPGGYYPGSYPGYDPRYDRRGHQPKQIIRPLDRNIGVRRPAAPSISAAPRLSTAPGRTPAPTVAPSPRISPAPRP